MATSQTIDLITDAQASEEQFLRRVFLRAQMSEFAQQPLLMARAEGLSYWDHDGKHYLDALSGIYVVSVGHRNSRVLEAMRRQLDTLSFTPAMHGSHSGAVRLANLLADLAPGDLDAVKFLSGGSETTEAAIKMSRQYHRLMGNPGKYKIVSRYLSWHGSTLGSLSASGLASRKTVSEPLAAGFVKVFPPTCYRCPFGQEYPSCELTCASLIDKAIELEDPDTVAAVFVEPIGHTGGIIDPPDEYLPMLREICDRHNVLLVFDEIITGAGRTGHLFAAETFGVVPDLLCLGKGISGGYSPLGALLCRRPVADAFWGPADENPGFVEGHTYEGNPLACAAGIATLQEIIERDLCGNAREMGGRLRGGLQRLRRHGIVGDIRGKGLLQGIEWVQDTQTRQPFDPPIGVEIGRRALELGLLTRFDPHWLALGPALVVSAEQIDRIVELLDQAIGDVLSRRGVSG